MDNEKHRSAVEAAMREAADKRAALEAELTYAARQQYNFLFIEQRRERYRQTQRLAEFKRDYEGVLREPGLAWKTSPTLRRTAWRYAAQLRLMTSMHRAQDRDRFLERAATIKRESEKLLAPPDGKAVVQRSAFEAPLSKQHGGREQTALTGNNSAAEAAFREAANRRAALEARLSEGQRAGYRALRQKQQAELARQERRLLQRREDYETEIRKQGIAPRLDMIPIDSNTPRALRDAAREYSSQDQWVADLKKAQERAQDKFLERAVGGEPEPETQRIEPDVPRHRPSRE